VFVTACLALFFQRCQRDGSCFDLHGGSTLSRLVCCCETRSGGRLHSGRGGGGLLVVCVLAGRATAGSEVWAARGRAYGSSERGFALSCLTTTVHRAPKYFPPNQHQVAAQKLHTFALKTRHCFCFARSSACSKLWKVEACEKLECKVAPLRVSRLLGKHRHLSTRLLQRRRSKQRADARSRTGRASLAARLKLCCTQSKALCLLTRLARRAAACCLCTALKGTGRQRRASSAEPSERRQRDCLKCAHSSLVCQKGSSARGWGGQQRRHRRRSAKRRKRRAKDGQRRVAATTPTGCEQSRQNGSDKACSPDCSKPRLRSKVRTQAKGARSDGKHSWQSWLVRPAKRVFLCPSRWRARKPSCSRRRR